MEEPVQANESYTGKGTAHEGGAPRILGLLMLGIFVLFMIAMFILWDSLNVWNRPGINTQLAGHGIAQKQ